MNSRLYLYSYYTKSIINIKSNQYIHNYNNIMSKMYINAGLYKPSFITLQHYLILSSLGGKIPILYNQVHGKRKRHTVSLNILLQTTWIWPTLDKLVHELFPTMADFKTPKWQKGSITHSYTFRLRQKLADNIEFSDLVDNRMHDSHKGVYLPLTLNLVFNHSQSHTNNEIYLRLLRLPISLFKRRLRPAFDDAVKFI